MLATNSPGLSAFKANSGKMATSRELTDEAIHQKRMVSTTFFKAPGVGHYIDGVGLVPNEALSQLVDQVEREVASDTLHATRGSKNMLRDLHLCRLQQRLLE